MKTKQIFKKFLIFALCFSILFTNFSNKFVFADENNNTLTEVRSASNNDDLEDTTPDDNVVLDIIRTDSYKENEEDFSIWTGLTMDLELKFGLEGIDKSINKAYYILEVDDSENKLIEEIRVSDYNEHIVKRKTLKTSHYIYNGNLGNLISGTSINIPVFINFAKYRDDGLPLTLKLGLYNGDGRKLQYKEISVTVKSIDIPEMALSYNYVGGKDLKKDNDNNKPYIGLYHKSANKVISLYDNKEYTVSLKSEEDPNFKKYIELKKFGKEIGLNKRYGYRLYLGYSDGVNAPSESYDLYSIYHILENSTRTKSIRVSYLLPFKNEQEENRVVELHLRSNLLSVSNKRAYVETLDSLEHENWWKFIDGDLPIGEISYESPKATAPLSENSDMFDKEFYDISIHHPRHDTMYGYKSDTKSLSIASFEEAKVHGFYRGAKAWISDSDIINYNALKNEIFNNNFHIITLPFSNNDMIIKLERFKVEVVFSKYLATEKLFEKFKNKEILGFLSYSDNDEDIFKPIPLSSIEDTTFESYNIDYYKFDIFIKDKELIKDAKKIKIDFTKIEDLEIDDLERRLNGSINYKTPEVYVSTYSNLENKSINNIYSFNEEGRLINGDNIFNVKINSFNTLEHEGYSGFKKILPTIVTNGNIFPTRFNNKTYTQGSVIELNTWITRGQSGMVDIYSLKKYFKSYLLLPTGIEFYDTHGENVKFKYNYKEYEVYEIDPSKSSIYLKVNSNINYNDSENVKIIYVSESLNTNKFNFNKNDNIVVNADKEIRDLDINNNGILDNEDDSIDVTGVEVNFKKPRSLFIYNKNKTERIPSGKFFFNTVDFNRSENSTIRTIIFNNLDESYENITVITTLPHNNDKKILNNEELRGSQFNTILSGAVIPPSGWKVYYTIDNIENQNFKNVNWVDDLEDFSKVKAIKYISNPGITLSNGEKVEFDIDIKIDGMAKPGSKYVSTSVVSVNGSNDYLEGYRTVSTVVNNENYTETEIKGSVYSNWKVIGTKEILKERENTHLEETVKHIINRDGETEEIPTNVEYDVSSGAIDIIEKNGKRYKLINTEGNVSGKLKEGETDITFWYTPILVEVEEVIKKGTVIVEYRELSTEKILKEEVTIKDNETIVKKTTTKDYYLDDLGEKHIISSSIQNENLDPIYSTIEFREEEINFENSIYKLVSTETIGEETGTVIEGETRIIYYYKLKEKPIEVVPNEPPVVELPTHPIEVVPNEPPVVELPIHPIELVPNEPSVGEVPEKPVDNIPNEPIVVELLEQEDIPNKKEVKELAKTGINNRMLSNVAILLTTLLGAIVLVLIKKSEDE